MKKRGSKKRSKPKFRMRLKERRPSPELEAALGRADKLFADDRFSEGLELLEPYLSNNSKVARLHAYLGYAYYHVGYLWAAANEYELALRFGGDVGHYMPLAFIFLDLTLKVSALGALRQVLKNKVVIPDSLDIYDLIHILEDEIRLVAEMGQRPLAKVEKGLLLMEEGERALHSGDYSGCISLNRKSGKFLGDWPPPWNNLSLALFYSGRPQEAIKIARQVIGNYPDNIQALSNIIRYLTRTGQEEEARHYWEQLEDVEPSATTDRLKKVEAAAILGEDESVYEWLRPLAKAEISPELPPDHYEQVQRFLAVAQANLGHFSQARQRLRQVNDNTAAMQLMVDAMNDGRSGPGYADRYPYFRSYELLPREALMEFIGLAEQADTLSEKAWQKQLHQFLNRYPQVIQFAEKMIWEEDQVEAGLSFLEMIDTPEAYAALRRFALSQAGPDHKRLHAMNLLQQAGQISPGEELKIWQNGEWRPVYLLTYEITDEPEEMYPDHIVDLLTKGQLALNAAEFAEAEQCFREILSIDPKNKTAYNNLATVYSQQGKSEQAKEMYQAALSIDPLYVFPRVNLAHYLIDEEKLEEANALLKPLAEKQRFHPQEMAAYSFAQARIAVAEEDYDGARQSLHLALQMDPDFVPAQNLLDFLEQREAISGVMVGWERMQQERAERDRKKRHKLQAKLATPDPTLADVLPLYTKDQLTGMGRRVITGGGWSSYRKGELIDLLISVLSDEMILARVVEELTDAELEALGFVLAGNGRIPWQQFADKYDDDMDESPHWNWHEPESVMGRLRLHGLLAEATVDGETLILIPKELRSILVKLIYMTK